MKARLYHGIMISIMLTAVNPVNVMAGDHRTLVIGAAAPDFSLPGIDGKIYTLSSFRKARLLVIIFTCNHCPTAQSYEDRIIKLTSDYADKKVAIVAIMEPVKIDTINEAALKVLVKNNSDKLRLINVWATWSTASTNEFQEFITINRMYRDRDFEFISISADEPGNKPTVLKFLQKENASNQNYILTKYDKYKLIEAINPKWRGTLPYTILVEPGSKIVFGKQGNIDPAELKKIIVDNHLTGRYP